jgi:peptidoglycan/LPS O-acetylase OafA/YrhL
MHADSKSSVRFRPDVEGLRAIAILFVVFDHLGVPRFRAGFVGVDVFFVISGFLITSLLAAEYRRSLSGPGSSAAGSIAIRGFYLRRARRILPASMFVIAVTLVTAKFVYNDVRFAEVQASALWQHCFPRTFS